MAKKPVEDRFCFTWGLPDLNEMGFVPLYQFMLRTYASLGISRQQMLCIIHLASYHYNSPAGESRPSLTTVAHQMGYAHKQRVWELIAKLEEDGRLIVTRRPGFTSIYNAAPFAKAAYDLWIANEAAKQQAEGVTTESNTPTGSVTPHSNTPTPSVTPDSDGVLLQGVTEEYKQEKKERGKEEDLSSLWTRTCAHLLNTMLKSTFDAHLAGSQLLPTDNGKWCLQVAQPRSVEPVQYQLFRIITKALATVSGEERDLEVVA